MTFKNGQKKQETRKDTNVIEILAKVQSFLYI